MIKYPYRPMALGAVDMIGIHKQVADLESQFQQAMGRLMAAWQSQHGSQDFQDVDRLRRQATDQLNAKLGLRAGALDDAQIDMQRADQRAANAAQDC
jgi:uncharacterized protein YukE